MKVLAGSASVRLGKRTAKSLGVEPIDRDFTRFPDGEGYLRLQDEPEEITILIQCAYPDENIMELFLMQDAIREGGGKMIITVIPYMGYSRQDKLFKEGEAVSARALVKHLELHTDALIFVDLHSKKILDFASKKAIECSAMPPIAAYFRDKDIDFVLSPDKGAVDRAGKVAKLMGKQFDYLEKTRLDGSTVKMAPKNLDVDGKSVLIVDDIIATGGTIIKATEQLKASGAERVMAACTHGLYTSNALERLEPALDGVYSTDTLESGTSKITVADQIASAVKDIVSEL